MPLESRSDFSPSSSPSGYFEEKPGRYFVYHDIYHHATLDYDPVAAVERYENEIRGKDEIIAKLQDMISEKESKIIDLIKDAQGAHEKAIQSSKAYNMIEIINAELRVRLRNLGNKIKSYGERIA